MHSAPRRCLVALALGVLVLAGAATAFASHSWSTFHWARTSNPFTLKVGDNMSATWDPFLDEAIADWSASSVLDLVKVTGGTRPRTCKATAGRIEACNEKYGFTGWLGIAQIWLSGSHITQAIAKMNDTYFNTATYNTPPWHRLVVCQEIAHDFGLDHQDVTFDNPNLGTCMDYTNDPDGPPSNEHPNAHDFAQLETIYAHLDSTSTVGPSVVGSGSPAMSDIDFAGPGQWGRLMELSQGGHLATFELDFGGNQKVITRVIFTDEVAQELVRARERARQQ